MLAASLPLRFFLVELLAPGARQGALVEHKLIPADLFDSPSDWVPVQRAQGLRDLDDH